MLYFIQYGGSQGKKQTKKQIKNKTKQKNKTKKKKKKTQKTKQKQNKKPKAKKQPPPKNVGVELIYSYFITNCNCKVGCVFLFANLKMKL